ncbi:hypothetical protein [Desulfomonile tiedjei]|uniref:Uncharacterized protein n=1 Tax=Desulfomonile tiedjei (strain ATCC 49306 / DSM 6799 / DCB-1) TaxID=706587 RepID=I4C192_DESTA|nr:hypothetical protein [Desulfomonile tiedjei]AFM23333.1 hypothetical protein Desti_0605 [Desulfomonile tiedjei DSM 6799]
MEIPEDPLEGRKWMLKLWREDYGARFSVCHPDDQPAPELETGTQECGSRTTQSRIRKEIAVRRTWFVPRRPARGNRRRSLAHSHITVRLHSHR